MNTPHTIDTTNAVDIAPSSIAATLQEQCRNCGRKVAHVMQDFCGRVDCDVVAAQPVRYPSSAETDDSYHVHDGVWSPVDISAYCKEVRARIAREQANHCFPTL